MVTAPRSRQERVIVKLSVTRRLGSGDLALSRLNPCAAVSSIELSYFLADRDYAVQPATLSGGYNKALPISQRLGICTVTPWVRLSWCCSEGAVQHNEEVFGCASPLDACLVAGNRDH